MLLPIVKIRYETDHDKLISLVENNIELPPIVWEKIYIRQKEDVECYDFSISNTEYYGRRWRLKSDAPRVRTFRYQNVVYQVTYNI